MPNQTPVGSEKNKWNGSLIVLTFTLILLAVGVDSAGLILPQSTFENLTVNGDLIIQGDILTVSDLVLNGSFLPSVDDMFDIGSPSFRWQDGFFSNSIVVPELLPESNNTGTVGLEDRRWGQGFFEKLNVSELGGFSPIIVSAEIISQVNISAINFIGSGEFLTDISAFISNSSLFANTSQFSFFTNQSNLNLSFIFSDAYKDENFTTSFNTRINNSDMTLDNLDVTGDLTVSGNDVAIVGNCPLGEVVQNTTTGGVECVTAAAGVTVSLEWVFRSSIIDANPGSGNFRINNVVHVDATQLFVSDVDDSGLDVSIIFNQLEIGDVLFMQQKDDATAAFLYTINDTIIDATTYFKIPVILNNASGGNIQNNRNTIFIFFTTSNQVDPTTDAIQNSTAWNRTEYVILANQNDSVGIGTNIPTQQLVTVTQEFNVTENLTEFITNATLFYRFEESSLITVLDSTSNRNDGILSGPTRIPSKGGNGTGDQAISFDGINDFVVTDPDTSLNVNGDMAFCLWINYTTSENDRILFDQRGMNEGYYLKTRGGNDPGELECEIGDKKPQSTTLVDDSQWHHICCVANSTATGLYIDGVLDVSVGPNTKDLVNDVNLFMGSKDGTKEFFTGDIDEVIIFNFSITAQNVTDIFNNGPTFITNISEVNVTEGGLGLVVSNRSNVGIGILNPTSALHVLGDVNLSGVVTIDGILLGSSPIRIETPITILGGLTILSGPSIFNDLILSNDFISLGFSFLTIANVTEEFIVSNITSEDPITFSIKNIFAMNLSEPGDLTIGGTFIGNQIYGEMYVNESFTVTIPSSGVWVNLSMDAAGELNGFTFQNDSLTAQFQGLYKIDTHFDYSNGANSELHTTIAINGIRENMKCIGQSRLGTAVDIGSLSTSCFVRLDVDDTIQLQIININSMADPTIEVGNFNLVRIGT